MLYPRICMIVMLLCALSPCLHGWHAVMRKVSTRHTTHSMHMAIRQDLSIQKIWKTGVMAALSAAILTSPLHIDHLPMLSMQPMIVRAAVGEGDLPPGAMAFSKVQQFQVS